MEKKKAYDLLDKGDKSLVDGITKYIARAHSIKSCENCLAIDVGVIHMINYFRQRGGVWKYPPLTIIAYELMYMVYDAENDPDSEFYELSAKEFCSIALYTFLCMDHELFTNTIKNEILKNL